jgi:hypothetical protein
MDSILLGVVDVHSFPLGTGDAIRNTGSSKGLISSAAAVKAQ